MTMMTVVMVMAVCGDSALVRSLLLLLLLLTVRRRRRKKRASLYLERQPPSRIALPAENVSAAMAVG
jgi:hypothetical protein